ncbi:MAG: hypothetical protein WC967_09390 [Balneolaceae bacterium]
MKKFLAGLHYPATFMEFITIHYSKIESLDKKNLRYIRLEAFDFFQNIFIEKGITKDEYIKKLFDTHVNVNNTLGSLSITIDSPLSVIADGDLRTKAAIEAYTKFTNEMSK